MRIPVVALAEERLQLAVAIACATEARAREAARIAVATEADLAWATEAIMRVEAQAAWVAVCSAEEHLRKTNALGRGRRTVDTLGGKDHE